MKRKEDSKSCSRRKGWLYWFVGLNSLIWLLIRSGTKPRRLVYPCQRVVLASSFAFVGYLLSLTGAVHLYRLRKRSLSLTGAAILVLVVLLAVGLQGSINIPVGPVHAGTDLPAWTSPSAVSDVFVVRDVPAPQCSLDGGSLSGTPPCDDAEYALHDDGVDALITLMESRDGYFYQTALHPTGIVSATDVVVIKINNQWGGDGSGDGVGRLATNTDVLKGLVWRILQHPDGFNGEIVVAENAQPISSNDWDVYPANAEDPGQSIQEVVRTFQNLGYAVSLFDWTGLNTSRISGGSIGDSGYPTGEYIHGNMSDAYILLEDPAGTGTDELSYPKFQTINGTYVSMRYGIWNGTSYESDRLTFINVPVLKRHVMAGATIAWKNLIGFVAADSFGSSTRYGDWDEMHDFYWGYTGGTNCDYGLLGRETALVRAPDLHLVDAIWVAYESNYQGDAVRQDVVLASTDPFAVDWYASEYILYPVTGSQSTSGARAGAFRDATRTNQNAAVLVWPGGSQNYPYIDLLDSYDGDVPSGDEKKQMNVYIVSPEEPPITLVSPNGGEVWPTGSQQQMTWTWTGTITDVVLSYSTDGFTSISHTIVVSTPNIGIYTWTTPITPSSTTRVRVADVANLTTYDDSDADFTLSDVGDSIPPEILAADPASGAVNVAVTTPVVITFSEPISASTFAYIVLPDPGGWSALWNGAGTMVTLLHDTFAYRTTYTATIISADDLAGNPLAGAPVVWSFTTVTTTDSTPPEVLATDPVSGAVDVAITAPVVITFSESVNAGTFAYTVLPDPGGWSAAWSDSATVVTLTHAAFRSKTVYTVTVAAVGDLAGNPLADAPYAWDFTTADVLQVSSVSPAEGAVDVAVTASVVITFSKSVSIGTFLYSVSPDPDDWAGMWSSNETVVTLTHNPFAYSTTYTVTICAAEDPAGSLLFGVPYVWHFATAPHRVYLPRILRSD